MKYLVAKRRDGRTDGNDTFTGLALPILLAERTDLDMTNLTSDFDALLRGHQAAPTKPFDADTTDEFLKEAYRIVRPSCFLSSPLLLSSLATYHYRPSKHCKLPIHHQTDQD